MDPAAGVSLLREARIPPPGLRDRVLPPVVPHDWGNGGPGVRRWRTAILPLHEAVEFEHLHTAPLGDAWGGAGTEPRRVLT
jgi:hypothetical protein